MNRVKEQKKLKTPLMSKASGFTLIEIIVTVIIVGILAALVVTNYSTRRRRIEYKGALSMVRTLASAAKNVYIATGSYVATSSTLDSNNNYGVRLSDTTFFNYSVEVNSTNFNVTVSYSQTGFSPSTANYIFDSNGEQISCVGADCMSF